jgi:hypothetical protein
MAAASRTLSVSLLQPHLSSSVEIATRVSKVLRRPSVRIKMNAKSLGPAIVSPSVSTQLETTTAVLVRTVTKELAKMAARMLMNAPVITVNVTN